MGLGTEETVGQSRGVKSTQILYRPLSHCRKERKLLG